MIHNMFYKFQFSDLARMKISRARLGPECFPPFVQATAFNKRVIMDYVMNLNYPENVTKGQANYRVALNYSYRAFEEVYH